MIKSDLIKLLERALEIAKDDTKYSSSRLEKPLLSYEWFMIRTIECVKITQNLALARKWIDSNYIVTRVYVTEANDE